MSAQPDVTVESIQPSIQTERRNTVITSGPMSEGILNLTADQRRRKHNDATEHVCMFSVCLMFIGIPIMVAGILVLSFYTAIGVIMLIVGVVASTSGAFMAILSAILTLFTKSNDKPTNGGAYTEAQTQPEIVIESTNYTESFDNNIDDDEPEHIQQLSAYYLSPDCPEKLDPVTWSNYPEAQNPKSYLQSFGELPKVIASPDVRSSNASKGKKLKHKSSKKSKRNISITKSMRLGGGRKRTMSRTSLTKDYSDDINFDTSSLSSTDSNRGGVSPVRTAKGQKTNQSIVTIETLGRDMKQDFVVAVRSSCDETNDEQQRTNNKTNSNGVLSQDIELNHCDQLTIDNNNTPDIESTNFADLWKTIRNGNNA